MTDLWNVFIVVAIFACIYYCIKIPRGNKSPTAAAGTYLNPAVYGQVGSGCKDRAGVRARRRPRRRLSPHKKVTDWVWDK